jgi:hypothetical protein
MLLAFVFLGICCLQLSIFVFNSNPHQTGRDTSENKNILGQSFDVVHEFEKISGQDISFAQPWMLLYGMLLWVEYQSELMKWLLSVT